MYTRNDLDDINYERARLIDEAITSICKHITPGASYTAYDLSRFTDGLIPVSIFEKCLSRGYHTTEKRKMMRPDNDGKYCLFGDWRAKGVIRKEGVRLITIKEYDEDGKCFAEYKKRRGRVYYTVTF